MSTENPPVNHAGASNPLTVTVISIVALATVGVLLVTLATVGPLGDRSGPLFAPEAWNWALPTLLVLLALQIARTVLVPVKPGWRWALAWANLVIQGASIAVGWYLVATRLFVSPRALEAFGIPEGFGAGLILSSLVLSVATIISMIDVVATFLRTSRASRS